MKIRQARKIGVGKVKQQAMANRVVDGAKKKEGGPMKERPIIFSGHSVNAIMAGRKTQTRRALKVSACHRFNVTEISGRWWYHDECQDPPDGNELRCPHGQPGDRLWVREAWLKLNWGHRHDSSKPNDWLVPWGDKPRRNGCAYKADATSDSERCRLELGYKKWTPSIYMPRWASRITLEVVSVRVERLLSITEDDAISEGDLLADNPDYDPDDPGEDEPQSHRAGFLESWDKLNAKRGYAWASNPWVWVITFKRVSNDD